MYAFYIFDFCDYEYEYDVDVVVVDEKDDDDGGGVASSRSHRLASSAFDPKYLCYFLA